MLKTQLHSVIIYLFIYFQYRLKLQYCTDVDSFMPVSKFEIFLPFHQTAKKRRNGKDFVVSSALLAKKWRTGDLCRIMYLILLELDMVATLINSKIL